MSPKRRQLGGPPGLVQEVEKVRPEGGVSLITSPVPYETQAAYHGTLEKTLEGAAGS